MMHNNCLDEYSALQPLIKTKLHIALFSPSLVGGGAERIMLHLACGIASLGMTSDLVLSRAVGPYLKDVPQNVNIIDLCSRRVMTSIPRLARYLHCTRPDVIVSAQDYANVACIIASCVAGQTVPVITTEHNHLSLALKNVSRMRAVVMPCLMGVFYRNAKGIVAVSEGVADDLAKTARFPRERIRVIYNPVVTPKIFKDAEMDIPGQILSDDYPLILGVGRLTKQKNFSSLIKAFSILRREMKCNLVILGQGEEMDSLSSLVKSLQIEDSVFLPGFVDNPYAFMKRASLIALSSRWEGLPTVIIEALSLGCQVVSTDCPSGPREILKDGRYGILVPVDDVDALADGLRQGLTHPKDRCELQFASRPFQHSTAILNYLAMIQDVVAQKGQQRWVNSICDGNRACT